MFLLWTARKRRRKVLERDAAMRGIDHVGEPADAGAKRANRAHRQQRHKGGQPADREVLEPMLHARASRSRCPSHSRNCSRGVMFAVIGTAAHWMGRLKPAPTAVVGAAV